MSGSSSSYVLGAACKRRKCTETRLQDLKGTLFWTYEHAALMCCWASEMWISGVQKLLTRGCLGSVSMNQTGAAGVWVLGLGMVAAGGVCRLTP